MSEVQGLLERLYPKANCGIILENVASMYPESQGVYNRQMGALPVRICPSSFSCYMRPRLYWVNSELIKAQGSKVQFPRGERKSQSGGDGDTARLSFKSAVLNGDHGDIDIVADINCEYNVAWGMEWDTWKLYSIGMAPRLLDDDDNRVLRQASADGYEVRVGAYLNLGCSKPGNNIRISLAS
jgi:hypothetical protein